MTVYYQDPAVQLLHGDVLDMLQTLPDNYVQTVVTSPPYWALRDYGIEGQLGKEETPQEYLAVMVKVFREVRRVMKADGTLWLNMGDSYNAQAGQQALRHSIATTRGGAIKTGTPRYRLIKPLVEPFKPKDLMGMPWRLAFALQADGWYLRADIIWHKPNPMPESVQDRPTKAHEYIFLLAKQPRYYYDFDAIKEPSSDNTHARYKTPDGWDTTKGEGGHGSIHKNGREKGKVTPKAAGVELTSSRKGQPKQNPSFVDAVNGLTLDRNKRSVWTIGTEPFAEAHFATFPEKLIEPCILAGAPEGGMVLDPFAGAATTLLVAKKLNRKAIVSN